MKLCMAAAVILVVGSLGALALAEGQAHPEAEKLWSEGKTLIARGDLNGAFKSFSAAARLVPENAEYEEEARVVLRVTKLRRLVVEGAVSPRWGKMAVSLHTWLLRRGLTVQALELSRLVHEKAGSALTASLLAEALLKADRPREAVTFLRGLDDKLLDTQNRLHLAIGLARQAREVSESIEEAMPDLAEARAGLLYDKARLASLLGEWDRALDCLVCLFEKTPPSRQADLRGYVRACADFRQLLTVDGFESVMSTRSKAKDHDCANCPNRGMCEGEEDHEESHEECGCEDDGDEEK